MTYSSLQTIGVLCFMVSAGFLAVSVLIFFLWDMRDIIGRLSGRAQKKALENMRSAGTFGKTGTNIVDMSVLEKKSGTLPTGSGRTGRRTGKTGKSGKTAQPPQPPKPAEAKAPEATPNYFGDPYPNKTPPTPIAPAAPEPQTAVIETLEQTTVIATPAAQVGGETMDLATYNAMHAQRPQETPLEDTVEPVKMTILDDILLIHTEHFIELS